jgi:hypothetical protein
MLDPDTKHSINHLINQTTYYMENLTHGKIGRAFSLRRGAGCDGGRYVGRHPRGGGRQARHSLRYRTLKQERNAQKSLFLQNLVP